MQRCTLHHRLPRKSINTINETGAILVDEEKCNGCGWCIETCEYGAITLHPNTHKVIICDTCNGDPKCIPLCPESALSLTGKSDDKIVTGDIGCYTLGCFAACKHSSNMSYVWELEFRRLQAWFMRE